MTEGSVTGDTGPGILETSLVLGVAAALAAVIVLLLGGPLADLVGILVDAAHGGR